MRAPIRPHYKRFVALVGQIPLRLARDHFVVWPSWQCGREGCDCIVLDQDLRENWRGVNAPTPWEDTP